VILLALNKHSVHPRPLGDATVGVIYRALPVRPVIDGVDLSGVRSPLARLWVGEGHAEHHGPLGRLWRLMLLWVILLLILLLLRVV